MGEIEFVNLDHVKPEELLVVLNEKKLREHLIDHAFFDTASLKDWIEVKVEIDSLPGCCVRAIYIGGVIAGWCGIQPDDKGFELAIVISQRFWGFGISIFKTLIKWARELGHKEVLFHLLESRPEYKFINNIATKVDKTELLGHCFTTYYIEIDNGARDYF